MRNPAPIIASLLLGALVVFLMLRPGKPVPPTPQPTVTPTPPTDLSILAEPPDWPSLNAYQYTISRSDFERLCDDN